MAPKPFSHNMKREEAERILEDAAARLGEHFDAVQILASGNEEGLTFCCKRGVGNWYARRGMAHEFINADQAQEIAHQIAQVLKPPPDEGEAWKTV